MDKWPNPFIEERADPHILRHEARYYFTGRSADAQPPGYSRQCEPAEYRTAGRQSHTDKSVPLVLQRGNRGQG